MSTYIKGPGLIQTPEITTTTSGTLSLTKDSNTVQILIGSDPHTVALPDATTLPLGRSFEIYNKSDDMVTVVDDDSTNLTVIGPDTFIKVTLHNKGSNEGEWALGESGGGGTPPGGDTDAVLVKASGSDGDVIWDNMKLSGFSARFNESFSSNGLRDTLTKIINFQYTPPTISLSGSSTAIREKGDTLSSITLTATIAKKSDPITTVRFVKLTGGTTTLDTQTSGGAIPNGGSSNYTYTAGFSDTTQFRAEVDDSHPTTVNSSTLTYNFVYPYYVGAGSSGLTPSAVALLTKRIIASTASRQEDITASAGDVLYFAYPSSYGALTKILDVNNFDTISDWTRSTVSITGLDSTSQSYYAYEFNNPVVAGTYRYTFQR